MSLRYQNEALQDRLAAEYVLGYLRGAARRRLAGLMRAQPRLRDKVLQWEERLFPLLLRAPPAQPPSRVWRAIKQRIAPTARRPWVSGWLRLGSGAVAAALVALTYLVVAPPREAAFTMVAVLTDARAQPAILVSWTREQAQRRQMALRILAHPSMPAGTSWQAWLLPAGAAAPISLGFVGTQPRQLLALPPAAAQALQNAAAIGMSVEGKDGSLTGRPTLPFLFQGPVLKVDS